MKNNPSAKMGREMQTVTMNREQVQTFAAAIRPQIKAYIESNRDKYEAWLEAEREHERSDSMSCGVKKFRRERNG